MKIYTKTGDAGETSLVGGKRVSKGSLRVCAYGDMDELISYIGLLRCEIPGHDAFLRKVQSVLMTGSAHIASENENPRLTPFPYEEIRTLEEEIDRLSLQLPPMKSFILPAGPAAAATAISQGAYAAAVNVPAWRSMTTVRMYRMWFVILTVCLTCSSLWDATSALRTIFQKIFGPTRIILLIFAAQKSTGKQLKYKTLCIGHLNWPRS